MTTKSPGLRTLGTIVIILLLLGVSFALFSYSYVSANQDYLTNRDLRTVGALGTQLKLKIENYSGNVLLNLADKVTKECEDRSADPCELYILSQQARKLSASKTLRTDPEGVKPPELSEAS